MNKKSLFKLEEKEKKFPMANTYNVKKFLVDQLKGDQTDLIKIKEVFL